MVALDTNVLVRLLNGDDAEQVARAVVLIDTHDCWVSHTVLLELAWILQRPLGVPKAEAIGALDAVLRLRTISTPHRDAVLAALDRARRGMDIADAIHLMVAETSGAASLATFDRRFVRQAAVTNSHVSVIEP